MKSRSAVSKSSSELAAVAADNSTSGSGGRSDFNHSSPRLTTFAAPPPSFIAVAIWPRSRLKREGATTIQPDLGVQRVTDVHLAAGHPDQFALFSILDGVLVDDQPQAMPVDGFGNGHQIHDVTHVPGDGADLSVDQFSKGSRDRGVP